MEFSHSEYVLLLGSNLGDPPQMLALARKAIAERIGDVIASSAVYGSEAWGFRSDDMFLNQALMVSSKLSPRDMLAAIHAIEGELGRTRPKVQGYASRTIDIDILHWDGGAVTESDLCIPHPGIAGRRFALVPMCEVAGMLLHPILGIPYDEMLHKCTDQGNVNELMII